MPRAHTTEERERIQERLLSGGREAFVRSGLAKVTIAQLAREAGIGKGSFYRFFDSKEELFLAIQEREEAEFKAELLRRVEQAGQPRLAVRALLLAAATSLRDHPFLAALLDPDTLAELTLRVPPERLAAHRRADRAFFIGLVRAWKARGWLRREVRPQLVFEVLQAMFVMSVSTELVDDATTRRASEELAAALAERWCP